MSDLLPSLPLPVTLRWQRVPPDAPGMPAFRAWVQLATSRQQVGQPDHVPGGRLPVSDATVDVYLSIWLTWIEWLAGQTVGWESATAAHVGEFLNSRSPARRRGGPVTARPSAVTKRRYWRVLREIYQAAVQSGLVVGHPVARSLEGLPSVEMADSAYLPPAQLARLRAALATAVRNYTPAPPTDVRAWQTPRDWAILAVLLDTGAKTAEVTGLRPEHVHFTRTGMFLSLGSDLPRSRQRDLGKQERVKRQLPLSAGGEAALRLWLATRQSKADACAAAGQRLNAWLFFSQKSAVSRGGQDPPMTHQPIYTLVSDFITVHLGPSVIGQGEGHSGPTVLRNSVLMDWLASGMEPAQVHARAGLAQDSQLSRLTRLVARE